MKSKLPRLIVVAMVILLATASNEALKSETPNTPPENNPTSTQKRGNFGTKIGIVTGNTTSFVVPPKVLMKAIKNDTISFIGYSTPENIFIDSINFLTYNKFDYYLYAKGYFHSITGSKITPFIISYELIYETDALFNKVEQQSVNICTGNDCGSCAFDTDGNGLVIGCRCRAGYGTGTCDHRLIALDASGSGYSLLNIPDNYSLINIQNYQNRTADNVNEN